VDADPLLLNAARSLGDAQYDPAAELLLVPAAYNPIHTRIVTGQAHRLRESLAYALSLLELARSGDTEVDGELRVARAERVLAAVLAHQDVDPASSTYGIWAYWAEEPLSEMSPPDWNWADFMGEYLALLLFRHAGVLDPRLREQTERALGHAARSIIRRNVDIDYTNIAVKGAFVTLAAGRLLDDRDLEAYGYERFQRLHAQLTRARSFAEYNSPSYWNVVIQAFTQVRQYLADPVLTPLAEDLERMTWEHFLARWHPATGQLVGPMARCYATDLRKTQGPLTVLQRVAPETWSFFDAETLAGTTEAVHDAVLDYRIPADLRSRLDRAPGRVTVRETFDDVHYIAGQVAGVSRTGAAGHPAVVVPATGTSWFDGPVTLGSINHSDTWLQRRVLLGYWAERGDIANRADTLSHSISASVVHDGFGFAAGSFSSVQWESDVLWSFSLATPAGDRHIHLDAVGAGEPLMARELIVRFSLRGTDAASRVFVDDAPVSPGTVVDDARTVTVRTAGAAFDWELAHAEFDGRQRPARVTVTDTGLDIDILWVAESEARPFVLNELGPVVAAGSVRLTPTSGGTGRTSDAASDPALRAEFDADTVQLSRVVAGEGGDVELRLVAPTRPGSRLDHARVAQTQLAFAEPAAYAAPSRSS
jgi:predicted secreted protein